MLSLAIVRRGAVGSEAVSFIYFFFAVVVAVAAAAVVGGTVAALLVKWAGTRRFWWAAAVVSWLANQLPDEIQMRGRWKRKEERKKERTKERMEGHGGDRTTRQRFAGRRPLWFVGGRGVLRRRRPLGFYRVFIFVGRETSVALFCLCFVFVWYWGFGCRLHLALPLFIRICLFLLFFYGAFLYSTACLCLAHLKPNWLAFYDNFMVNEHLMIYYSVQFRLCCSYFTEIARTMKKFPFFLIFFLFSYSAISIFLLNGLDRLSIWNEVDVASFYFEVEDFEDDSTVDFDEMFT